MLNDSYDGLWSVEAPVINPNDCGKIGGWDIPGDEVETCFEHRNVDGTEQATKPDDFVAGGREEQMVLNEFVEELDVAIKQDGHDIYCDAETAKMLKSLINDGEKPKRLRKICTIYATPPGDTKKVDELLKNTDFYIATGYDDNVKFRYEVFEKIH